MRTLVMKFGGLSVGTTTALTQVLSIVLHEYERWDRLLIVVSALEGVTDALIEATRLAQLSNRRGYRRIAATLRTRHLALIDHLPFGNIERQAIQADIDRLLFEMLDELQSLANASTNSLDQATVDSIIGAGERLAARIVAALIRQNNIRAVAIDTDNLIITDNNFGNATPDISQSRKRIEENLLPMLDRSIVPVVTGFIGSTINGKLTTLGRGGSDYTATVISICSQADEVWIWTDVDGMMTTDPREIETARIIPEMTYSEVGEMAYFGARVLHAHMIGPLSEHKIPLRIKNVFKPQLTGTLIHQKEARPPHIPKAVTMIQAIGLTAERSGPLSNVASIANETLMQTAGSPAEVMIASQSSAKSLLCFIVPTTSGPGALRTTIEKLNERLKHDDTDMHVQWTVEALSVVTVIGSHFNEQPFILANIFNKLNDISIIAVTQGPSNCSLSIIVKPDVAYEAQERIHDYVLNMRDQ